MSDHTALQRMFNTSDAVFGLALTLLVLDVRPPEAGTGDLAMQLRALVSPMVAFVGTFAVVSFFWIAHVSILRRMVRFDWPVACVNLGLLLAVALMPFASALLGRHPGDPVAWQVYSAANIAISIMQTVLWLTASRGGGRLMGGDIGLRERVYRTIRGLSPGIAFTTAFGLAVQDRADLAVYAPLLIFPVMILARLFVGPAPRRPA